MVFQDSNWQSKNKEGISTTQFGIIFLQNHMFYVILSCTVYV